MTFLENILSILLGYLMFFCYFISKNYGVAIIFFTLLTKIVLWPLSVWVQKNSVKIVRLTPELNHIRADYFGDKDMIAEKSSELYKSEKYNPFASLVPLFVQIILLMGLVQVIYNPLTHLYHLDERLCGQMIALTCELTGADSESSSIQMTVVDTIKNQDFYDEFLNLQSGFPDVHIESLLEDIKASNMELLGISMGLVPSETGGITFLMPIIAAIAALILCLGQNKLNPLQAEQGKLNQIGMTVLSVGISLFLGAFVPLGVGFYWVWSNLFSLLQQVLLNKIINPKDYIDYEALEKSKEALAGLEDLGKDKRGILKRNPYAKKEREDYKRFFSIANKHFVVYSEGSGYYKYFKNIIEYILEHSNVTVHYITNDPKDQIFVKAKENSQIKPYYIGEKKLITLMMKMDADIVLMTTPDLDNYYLKRSYVKKDVEYIYTNHGVGSDNLTLRTHALDNFDTIFAIGPNIIEEQRALEKEYGLAAKNLVETGYCLLDDMIESYEKMERKENKIKTILVAPSWQKDNLLDSCLDELLSGIIREGYRVIVRPHPQYVRLYPMKVERILEQYKDNMSNDFVIETDFSSNVTVYSADLLITDWSNIGYEFSFTTRKPTLYINTPMKVMNPEWKRINIVPFDIKVREEIGASLDLDKLSKVGETVDRLIRDTPAYYDAITALMNESFYHIGHSGEVSGKYILNRLKEKQERKRQ